MQSQKLTTDRSGLALAVGVAILFGFYPPCLHVVYAAGGNASFVALVIVWARAMGLTIHCLIRRKPMFETREDIRQGFIGGFFQAISSGFTMLALDYLQGSLVVIILYTHTLMLLFFMVWKRDIKFSFLTMTIVATALTGLSLVLDIWHQQTGTNMLGMGFAFIAAAAIVPRLYVYGTQTMERDPAVVGAENFLIAAILTLPVLFIQIPAAPQTLAGNAWMFIGATTLATGTFYTFYGIAALGSFSWSLLQKLQPVFTALISALLISEILKPHQYVGMLLVLTSLVFYQFIMHRRRVAAGVSDND